MKEEPFKECLGCYRAKSLDAFGEDKSQDDGLNKYCRDCINRSIPDTSYWDDPESNCYKCRKRHNRINIRIHSKYREKVDRLQMEVDRLRAMYELPLGS